MPPFGESMRSTQSLLALLQLASGRQVGGITERRSVSLSNEEIRVITDLRLQCFVVLFGGQITTPRGAL